MPSLVERRVQHLRGGGDIQECTLLEVANWFADQYLPSDLTQVSVRFPNEKIDLELETQCPTDTTILEETSQSLSKEEKTLFDIFLTHYAGFDAEYDVWKYLQRNLKTTTALLHNYRVKMFRQFTGTEDVEVKDNQEFDFFFIFAEFKKFVHIEVKAGNKGGKGWVEQLKKGKKFYDEVLDAIGGDEYKDWEYIPVGAFPMADNETKVKGWKSFLAGNPKGLIISKQELNIYSNLEDLLKGKLGDRVKVDESYVKLVKILLASANCAKPTSTMSLSLKDLVQETQLKLVGAETPDISAGVSTNPVSSKTSVTFSSLKGAPVGSLNSILFWNQDQAQFLFQDVHRCIISGEFGSGKTLLLTEKMRFLLDKGKKVVFISCLLPNEGYIELPPIYEVLMRKNIEQIGLNCKFYSAQEICRFMKVDVKLENFYDVLDRFIQKLKLEENLSFILDEYGDDMEYYSHLLLSATSSLAQIFTDSKAKNDFITDSDEISLETTNDDGMVSAKTETAEIIISLHPRCNIKTEEFKDQGYTCLHLKSVMRNTASIYGYEQAISQNQMNGASPTTVLGLSPVCILNTGDDFYSKILDEVCQRSRKFVCLKDNGFDPDRFLKELNRKKIKQFMYNKRGDEKNLAEFGETKEGCLITNYNRAKGIECTTLIVFLKKFTFDQDSRILRGTTYLIVPYMEHSEPLSIKESGQGYFTIKAQLHNPTLYRKLVELLLEKKVQKYVLARDGTSSADRAVKLFQDELRRQRLPPLEEKLEPDCSVRSFIAQKGGVVFKASYDEIEELIANNIHLIYMTESRRIGKYLDAFVHKHKPELFVAACSL